MSSRELSLYKQLHNTELCHTFKKFMYITRGVESHESSPPEYDFWPRVGVLYN